MTKARRTDLLLGADARQRVRASQSLLALVVYAVFALLQHGEVLMGLIEARASWGLTAWNVGGGLGFFLLVRSGLNLKLPLAPALTVPQMIWAMVGIAWSYAITGPARGAVVGIMVVVLMFGMFALPARQARLLTLLGFGMLAGVMGWNVATDAGGHDPRVEIVHLSFAAVVMGATAALSIRLGALRQRLGRQKAELEDALQRIQALATRDALTGLLNRRAMVERLGDELRARQAADGGPFIALIDLDHFKRVNDTHGHAAGDGVLRGFADAARAELHEGDVLARWGGEEFLLLLSAPGPAQAQAVLGRIRSRLQTTPFDEVAPGLVVTFSAGVARCAGPHDLEAAVYRADRAMYQAKTGGRDRVLVGA